MSGAITFHPGELPFPFSRAVEVNGILYLSGQVSRAADAMPIHGSVAALTTRVTGTLATVLQQLGAVLADVFKRLSDRRHCAELNQAYAACFSGHFPARSVVGARLASLDVEIDVQALAPPRT